jgi:hypothetical protein
MIRLVIPKKINTKTTNDLNQAIIDYIQYSKGSAWRINTTGVPKVVDGKLVWRKSRSKGHADVSAVYEGLAIYVETKVSKSDDLNPDQVKFKQDVERAKGKHIVAKDIDDFLLQWEIFLKEHGFPLPLRAKQLKIID